MSDTNQKVPYCCCTGFCPWTFWTCHIWNYEVSSA